MSARVSSIATLQASTLVSSAHGRIEQVLFTVPYWVLRYARQPEIRPFIEAYSGLLTLLPGDVDRVVVTRAEVADIARAWLDDLGVGERSRVVPTDDELRFTPWAQDAALVQATPDGPCLLRPRLFSRRDDAEVLARAATSLSLPIRHSDLIFQGGNVLVGDDFWLMGADAILETIAVDEATEHADETGVARGPTRARVPRQTTPAARAAEVVARFGSEVEGVRSLHLVESQRAIPDVRTRDMADPLQGDDTPWREFINTGIRDGSRQPLFDIDTFISLAGRGADGRYRLLVGDPRAASDATSTPLPDHALADVFDDVARTLTAAGFDVVRNPLPLVWHDDGPARTRWWYFATSNNVITEIDGDRHRVWMPTYGDREHPGLRQTDALNAALWRGLGFEVVLLPSFHVVARGLGAARCIMKVLRRRP